MSRDRGDRRSSRNGAAPKTIAQKFAALLAAKGQFAFEARSNTNDGTNVQTFVDLIDPTRVLTVTGTLAKPVANALFANALTCTFNGTQSTANNKAVSAYRFMHDGTGMEVRHLCSLSGALQVPFGTVVGTAAGYNMVSSGTSLFLGVYQAAGTNLVGGGGLVTFVNNVAASVHARFSSSLSPNWTNHVSGGVDATGAQGTSPGLGDPAQSFAVSPAGGTKLQGSWFGSYGFLPLTTQERALVDAYATAATGIAVP